MVERSGDQVWEELVSGQRRGVLGRQCREHAGVGEQRRYGVIAEERREQAPDRRQVTDLAGDLGRHALGPQAIGEGGRQCRGQPNDHE
jgi:hypothetical protein